MLNVVTADMWLEASCEDAGKPLTFQVHFPGRSPSRLDVYRQQRFVAVRVQLTYIYNKWQRCPDSAISKMHGVIISSIRIGYSEG